MVAICAAVLLLLGMMVRDLDSFALTLVGTAVAAVAVNPLRLVLQRAVDRLMYGDRRDPYAGLTRLAERLEATIAPHMALRTIVDTVAESLKVPFVAVDLVQPGLVKRMAAHGAPGGGDALTVPLAFQGEPVGHLVVENRGAMSRSTRPTAICSTSWHVTQVRSCMRSVSRPTCSGPANGLCAPRRRSVGGSVATSTTASDPRSPPRCSRWTTPGTLSAPIRLKQTGSWRS